MKLEYQFEEGTELDYIIYYSRSENGNFGKFPVEVCTNKERTDYKEIKKGIFT
uniref:hypothetical protein n=1 Tax=Bacteroides fragilis TaxID=817 RepID=UPI003566E086